MKHSTPIYLDYAAATPVDPKVLAAMQPFWAEQFYNPSATYLAAQQVRQAYEAARNRVAHALGARPTDITFTAGGTEANNLAIHGIMQQFSTGNIVVSGVEHDSVLAPASQYNCRIAPVDEHGSIKLDELAGLIDDTTTLVSVMYANNEVGTIQPIRKLAQLVQTIRAHRASKLQTPNSKPIPLYLHTDACQAGLSLDLHVSRLGVDLMTINGGKLYGPKQSGLLYAHHSVRLAPQILGGGQERNLRSGTENVAGAVGLSIALEAAQAAHRTEAHRLQQLQQLFFAQLAQHIPSSIVNGSRKNRLPNNVHVTFPGSDNERLLMQLDEQGIMAAAGSACSASNEEPSHVLRAMGIDEAAAQASLRFTMGKSTNQATIHHTLETLRHITNHP